MTVLESSIKDLEKRLSEQEEEANNVISQWRSTCNELEAKNTELTHTLKHTREQPASNSSEGQQEPFAALQAELDETKTELATAKTQLTESEGVVLKWEEKVAELESTIKSMEEQLTEQEEEASTAISKWQESCTALEERNVELLKALGEAGAGAKDAESVVVKEARPQESFSTSPKEMVETKTALSESQAKLEEAESVIVKWEGEPHSLHFIATQSLSDSHFFLQYIERVAELELRVKDMEAQLSEQEVEANTAITKWQESCAALEEKNTELMKSLEASGEDDQEVSHESIASLEAKLKETETALAEARESLTDDGDVVLMWQGE